MRDMDKFEQFLQSFGIGYDFTQLNEANDSGCQFELVCRSGMAKVDNYGEYEIFFQFGANGEFIQMGAGE